MDNAQKADSSLSASELRPLRVAILGGGAVTSEFYIPASRLVRDISIVAVVDPSSRALSKVAEAGFSGKTIQSTSDDFLNDESSVRELGLDAVIIALPNFLHETAVCRALELGLNVLCEKPLALSELSCKRMYKASIASGKMLSVGMVRRFTPSVSILKEILSLKVLGEIRAVTLKDGGTYRWTSESGAFFDPRSGGLLADMGVHFLDILTHLFGSLTPILYEDDYRGGCEADLTYHLKTGSQVPVSMLLSRYREIGNTLKISGTLGTAVVKKENLNEVFVELSSGNNQARYKISGTPKFPCASEGDLNPHFALQYDEFFTRIRNGSSPAVGAEQAAEVIRLIEWAYQNRSNTKGETAKSGRPILPAARSAVTGATGFIGVHLVERLNQLQHNICSPVRNFFTTAELARFPVELPKFDLLNYESCKSSLKGSRYVFHLTYGKGSTPGTSSEITIEGTKNIVNAAIEVGAEVVVVLSTMFVFPRKDNSQINEETNYGPVGGEYGKSKSKMERWCLERSKSAGKTRIVVLNPSFVYGPRGQTFSLLPVSLARNGQFCFVENGIGTANYVYIDNLIDAMLLAAQTEKAHGQRFLINDGDVSWKEFYSPIFKHFKLQVPDLTIAKIKELNRNAQESWLELLKKLSSNQDFRNVVKRIPGVVLLGRKLVKNTARSFAPTLQSGVQPISREVPPLWLVELFSPSRVKVDADKAKQVLQWQPRVSLKEGQARTIAWLNWHQGD